MNNNQQQATSKSQLLRTQVQAHIEELAKATDKARFSEGMQAYLDTCARFHKYSPSNAWLIHMSKPDATHVAGFHHWKKLGRFVHKGEKGIPILAPLIYKEDPDDNDSASTVRGFRVVHVFDVSQTDGDPLPPVPEWKSEEQHTVLSNCLLEYAKELGIEVEFSETLGEVQGVSHGGKIVLAKDAGTKTFIHELAHELMHRNVNNIVRSKMNRELEAEAVAYVVARHFGIQNLECPNYIALHGIDARKLVGHMDRITKTASKMICELAYLTT